MKMKCLYCNTEKSPDDFCQEHVIPRKLGGNFTPINPFSINNVCKRCNTIAGMFIDEPFIKSYFNYSSMAQHSWKYINLKSNPILPCFYIGISPELLWGNKLCELWLGPTGDTIYHFHEPYPEEPNTTPVVGVPAYTKKYITDAGFVFIFVRATNPEWHPCIINSVINQFNGSILYLGNGPKPELVEFQDIPETLKDLHLRLKSLSGERHHAQIPLSLHYGDRFLAKIALGIGAVLLKSEYQDSNSANLLRNFMWCKDINERKKIPVSGVDFLAGQFNGISELLSWNDGHVLMIMPIKNELVLFSSFYGKQTALMQISHESDHWDGIINDSMIYLLVPAIQKVVGPKLLVTYLAHRHNNFKDKEILELESAIEPQNKLPPYDL